MFEWIMTTFKTFKTWLIKIFRPDLYDPKEELESRSNSRDNIPKEPIPELKPTLSSEEKEEPSLWYPNRIKNKELEGLHMKTRGYYNGGFPRGAVIHYTAGRSRNREMGGSRNALTRFEQGMREVRYACSQPYCFFLIDRDGNVFQQFPLDRWGYHAGKSSFPGLYGRVSNELVGIEVMCAGRVEQTLDGHCKAWFTDVHKGDNQFSMDECEYWHKTDNVKEGHYHKFSDQQKAALADLVLWMDKQSSRFFIEYVLGHDEVSSDRKSDPGGSLGMTMDDFRDMLRDIKKVES